MSQDRKKPSQGKKEGEGFVSVVLRLLLVVKTVLEIFELALKYFGRVR